MYTHLNKVILYGPQQKLIHHPTRSFLRAQTSTVSSLRCVKIWRKCVHLFFRNIANRETNKQTNVHRCKHNICRSAEVTSTVLDTNSPTIQLVFFDNFWNTVANVAAILVAMVDTDV